MKMSEERRMRKLKLGVGRGMGGCGAKRIFASRHILTLHVIAWRPLHCPLKEDRKRDGPGEIQSFGKIQ